MALASAYGLHYNLPQDQMGQGRIRGGLAGQEQGLDFGQDDMLNADLYVKEGVTDEYYKKVSAIKSFANEVSSRYGYDVTRPNYRDPESIRFHKAYLESLADLQATQNELKRLGQQENIAIQNPNVRMQNFEDGSTQAVNQGANDLVRGLQQAAQRINSREGLEGFTETKEMLLEQLEEELSNSTDNRERFELQATMDHIKAINPDVGISDFQQAQLEAQSTRDAENRKFRERQLAVQAGRATGGKPTQAQLDAQSRIETMLMLTDDQTLSSMGLERHDTMAGTYLSYKGGKERIKVDPENPQSFVNNINRMLNEDKSTTSVGIDRLHNVGVDLNQLGQLLSERLGPRSDVTPQFLENLPNLIGSAKQDPEIGNALASMLEKGLVIPPDLSSKFGTGGKKDTEISSARFKTPFMGALRETPGFIKIKVGNKNVELDLNNAEDIATLSQIIDYNANYLELNDIQGLMPGIDSQVVPPNQGSGTTIAPDASVDISIDDF